MIGLKTKLIIGAIIGLIIAGLCGVISWQHQANAALLKDKTEQTQLAKQRLLSIRTMEANAKTQAEALQALAQQQHQINTEYSKRENHIKRLEHENKSYRDWANNPLPQPVKRLRQRPAITGSSEYRQWLSGTHPMLPASGATPTERPPDH